MRYTAYLSTGAHPQPVGAVLDLDVGAHVDPESLRENAHGEKSGVGSKIWGRSTRARDRRAGEQDDHSPRQHACVRTTQKCRKARRYEKYAELGRLLYLQ